MSDDDNVTHLFPPVVSKKPVEPDWLTAANGLGLDEDDKPMAFVETKSDDLTTALETSLKMRGVPAAEVVVDEVKSAKRAEPIDPLRREVLVSGLVLAALIFATSALFSFATVAAAAEWMMPAWGWLVWLVPGFIEAFIVWFGLDAMINQARGRTKEYRSALGWMLVFASVAVIANAAHTVDQWGSEFGVWQSVVGTLLSAVAPLSVVLITKRVIPLVFTRPEA